MNQSVKFLHPLNVMRTQGQHPLLGTNFASEVQIGLVRRDGRAAGGLESVEIGGELLALVEKRTRQVDMAGGPYPVVVRLDVKIRDRVHVHALGPALRDHERVSRWQRSRFVGLDAGEFLVPGGVSWRLGLLVEEDAGDEFGLVHGSRHARTSRRPPPLTDTSHEGSERIRSTCDQFAMRSMRGVGRVLETQGSHPLFRTTAWRALHSFGRQRKDWRHRRLARGSVSMSAISWPRKIMMILGLMAIGVWILITLDKLSWFASTPCLRDELYSGPHYSCGDARRGVFLVSAGAAVIFALPGAILMLPAAIQYGAARRRASAPQPPRQQERV